LYLNQHEDRLVILDEIHRVPGIFETLRNLIDRRRRKGNRSRHFLLLGSASIDLLHQSAETLAGRIAYEELTPFSVAEVAFLTASLPQATRTASVGALLSSRPILSATCLCLARVSQRRRFAATGRCWLTTRVRC
jgi:predicted AAA+ superfamily ATPase